MPLTTREIPDFNLERYFVVSHDPINRKYPDLEAIYWEDFLEKLWCDEIIT